ncbi:hypothetical protein QWY90_12890 [Flavobacterium paronense]|uniref:Uncharacterized protein n=1 Tax=Flavobacterium paronense TaxID=1392775 RepID=A0ABV5GE36_9FLAO|nr:hypothetical protein [Flavobacterium paronense]MDN3678203.1 hypothetical protein [Flavobacterium paronense]
MNFFSKQNHQPKAQLLLAFFFTVFTIVALGIDSVFFTNQYFDARGITNVLAILYFGLLFFTANLTLRKLMIIMVPLSYIGEIIFCKILGFYHYRTAFIPLYVPFGHAIVYASGYIFADTNWAVKNEKQIRIFFIGFFILLFAAVGFLLNDMFSLLFGALFFLLLKRKCWQNLYCFIALCVIFIELVGTYFQCWTWNSKTFKIISTVNPPMGAVFFYAGGDVLLVKIISILENKKLKMNIQ